MTIRLSRKQWDPAKGPHANLPLSVRKARERDSKRAKVVSPKTAQGRVLASAEKSLEAEFKKLATGPLSDRPSNLTDEVRVVSKAKAHAGEKK